MEQPTFLGFPGLLADKPSLTNSSPFQDGWIAKLKIDKMDEFNALMDQAEYDKFTQ
jgi:glycine cleavage system H lipoate-binding protein